MVKPRKTPPETVESVRCAVYARKSTEEGLDRDFNSLDAQRESAEAYITSMKGEGWVCLPEYYDDGGFSGGTMERPAFRRLMGAVEKGKIDCLVVYKVDRLSRSLLDFSRIMETLEKNHVSFVSVTQQFNTTHSLGRLTLNILLSFAQFEREIIGERTRDKMAAARRKGKWTGGMPVLGYDVDARGGKLIVNALEAGRVRGIFELYIERQSLLETAKELALRGWTTKRWITRKGHERGGKAFGKNNLSGLLGNVLYLGKQTYRDETFPGEHDPIIDEPTWKAVRSLLNSNNRTGGTGVRNKHDALLRGILYCSSCNSVMVHSITNKKGKDRKNGNKGITSNKPSNLPISRYRYYVCSHAQKNGWDTCPTKSLPGAEIERFVVDRIRGIGKDRKLLKETLFQAQKQYQDRIERLNSERLELRGDLRRLNKENTVLVGCAAGDKSGESAGMMKLADNQDKMERAEKRIVEIDNELEGMKGLALDDRDLALALSSFDPVWEGLSGKEKGRMLRLLIERIGYDGKGGKISITFRPTGIKSLVESKGKERE